MARATVAVVDFGGGNLASAARALEAVAGPGGPEIVVTGDPAIIARASRIVLPGQGAFADCARGLHDVPDLWDTIDRATETGTPFLGICVGMQLMAARGLEHGQTPGFGWLAGDIAPLPPTERLPHMGWNALAFPRPHPLTDGLAEGTDVYFVHSYAWTGAPPDTVIATTDYGAPLTAMVAHRNRAGTQFHVEKSQSAGLRILANFLAWQP